MIEITETKNKPLPRVKSFTSCVDCDNKDICKYVESFKVCEESLKAADIPDILTVEISCKYHKPLDVRIKKSLSPIRGKDTSNSLNIRVNHKHSPELPSPGDNI